MQTIRQQPVSICWFTKKSYIWQSNRNNQQTRYSLGQLHNQYVFCTTTIQLVYRQSTHNPRVINRTQEITVFTRNPATLFKHDSNGEIHLNDGQHSSNLRLISHGKKSSSNFYQVISLRERLTQTPNLAEHVCTGQWLTQDSLVKDRVTHNLSHPYTTIPTVIGQMSLNQWDNATTICTWHPDMDHL